MTLDLASAYAREREANGDPHARERAEAHGALLDAVAARSPPPGILIDAGGGDGALAARARARGYRAYTLDLLGRADVRGSFEAMPARRADVVVFSASLHYARDVDLALRQAPAPLVAVALTPVHDDPARARVAAAARGLPGYRHLVRADLERALAPFARVEWLAPGFREAPARRILRALRPAAYADLPLVVAQR